PERRVFLRRHSYLRAPAAAGGRARGASGVAGPGLLLGARLSPVGRERLRLEQRARGAAAARARALDGRPLAPHTPRLLLDGRPLALGAGQADTSAALRSGEARGGAD